MSYTIQQVKNICDENTEFKLQMVYNQTRSFEIIPNPYKLNNLHIKDKNFICRLFLKENTFQMKYDYDYKTIIETRKLLLYNW